MKGIISNEHEGTPFEDMEIEHGRYWLTFMVRKNCNYSDPFSLQGINLSLIHTLAKFLDVGDLGMLGLVNSEVTLGFLNPLDPSNLLPPRTKILPPFYPFDE